MNTQQGLRLWPGLATCAVLALAAASLAEHHHGPVMLFALLLGMALNFLSDDSRCKPGIDFVAQRVLRWAIALLGLNISLDQVQALGWAPVIMTVLAVALTIALSTITARLFGLSPYFGFLSGGAVGICGVSAAMAISSALPSHPQKDRATTFVVISVSTLSTLAMMVYPVLVQWWGLEPKMAGVILGATIHDVAQVVGAAYSLGSEVGDTATLVKLIRVAMLVPVVAAAVWLSRRVPLPPGGDGPSSLSTPTRPPLLPGFVLVFAGLIALRHALSLPPQVTAVSSQVSGALLVAAMAAIGMRTHLKDILGVGIKPLLMVVMETAFLALAMALMLLALPMLT